MGYAPGSVVVGGVPAGATGVREVLVLRGVLPARPVATCRRRGSVPRPGARTAITDAMARRSGDRRVVVFGLGELWRVQVLDGHGRLVLDVAEGGVADEAVAGRIANHAWTRLRALAVERPDRWSWA